MRKYDICIIGAGPGGYIASIRASQLGAKVALIEKERLGGVCLNCGCIPSKSLKVVSDIIFNLKRASQFGITISDYTLDFNQVKKRNQEIIERLRKGIEFILKKRGVEVIFKKAHLISKNTIELESHSKRDIIEADKIIIATGSSPAELSGIKFDSRNILSSLELLNISEPPAKLLIIGGGVIGCELAYIFHQFGTKITLVEMMNNVLPQEDIQIARLLKQFMKKQGIDIKTSTKIERLEEASSCLIATFSDSTVINFDKALICVGRRPNVKDIGLENAGIELKDKEIAVDNNLRTSQRNIFAIGDCIGGKLLAHKASYEGRVAAENALCDEQKNVSYNIIPRCIFTHPEAACVGLTEEETAKLGYKIKKINFPYQALGKANCLSETQGMIKLIGDIDTDKLLGVHIIGFGATELIGHFVLGMAMNVQIHKLKDIIFAHPTLSEIVTEAVHLYLGEPIHII